MVYCTLISTSLLPVICLNYLNNKYSGAADLSEQASIVQFNENGVSLVEIIFSVLAGPGLNLFNYYGAAQHFFFFMDDTFPFLKITHIYCSLNRRFRGKINHFKALLDNQLFYLTQNDLQW